MATRCQRWLRAARRNEADDRLRLTFDGRSREEERNVVASCPERKEIAVVRAEGIGGFAGRVDGDRIVPVARVEHHAHRCAGDRREIRRAVCGSTRRRRRAWYFEGT